MIVREKMLLVDYALVGSCAVLGGTLVVIFGFGNTRIYSRLSFAGLFLVALGLSFGMLTPAEDAQTQILQTHRSSVITQPHQVQAFFTEPEHLRVGTTTTFELRVGILGEGTIREFFSRRAGRPITKNISVGDAVSAKLTADTEMLQISSRFDYIQTYTDTGWNDLHWLWDVKPLRPGKTLVTLEIMSHHKNDGIDQVVIERALRETWEVEQGTGLEAMKYYWMEYEWLRTASYSLLTGIVAALGYFGIRGAVSKSDDHPKAA